MDINKQNNLPKEYWDNMENKYPGYVFNFLTWAESYLRGNKGLMKYTINQFYHFPLAMQLGVFWAYISHTGCPFEVNVADMDQCVELIEEYFCDERHSVLVEKQNFKSGNY